MLALIAISGLGLQLISVIAQDIITSSDISNGASVFVFRQTSKKAQVKQAMQKTFVVARTKKRRKINSQLSSVRQKKTTSKITLALRENRKIEISDTLTAKADTLFQQKQIGPAIQNYREALRNNPKNQNAANGLSDALTAKGISEAGESHNEIAIPTFNEAVRHNNKNAVAYANLGDIHFANERTEQAISNFEKALSFDPDLTELYTPLGLAYVAAGEITKAEIELSKADSVLKPEAETEYLRGLIFYKQNKNDDALAAFSKTLMLDPDSVLANYYLAAVYDRLNQTEQSIAAYKKTIDIEPAFAPAYFDLGVTYYNDAHYEYAEQAYKKTVKIDYENSEAHANLASTHRQLGEYAEANGEYKIAAEGIKGDADLFSEWGYCLGKVGNWTNAIARLETARSIAPEESVYTNLGWAYYNAGQELENSNKSAGSIYAKAKNSLQEAIEINPHYAAAYLNLGSTHNALGEFHEAVNSLSQAVALDSNWVAAINELGVAYRGLNDLAKASAQFKRAVSLDDKFALGFYNLGEAEYQRGNKKEAKKARKILAKLSPSLAQKLNSVITGKKKKRMIKSKTSKSRY